MTLREEAASMQRYLHETPLLDYRHPAIVRLAETRQWAGRPVSETIGAIYSFVQNEIPFGYNAADDLPASAVLADGYGQCNTKGTLFMALLRQAGIPCRFHGLTIDKRLQQGALTGLTYLLAPREIIHSWVEVWYAERWVNLEGFILDADYLRGLRCMFPDARGAFCGYGVATSAFEDPPIAWIGSDTYIQKEGIQRDFGVFDTPDAFYAAHGGNLSGVKRTLYRHVLRKLVNANVARIRGRAGGAAPSRRPSISNVSRPSAEPL